MKFDGLNHEELKKVEDKAKKAKLKYRILMTIMLALIGLSFIWWYFTIK